jgi:hypothetical protein
MSLKEIYQGYRDSKVGKVLHYDISMKDFVSASRFSKMQTSKTYKIFSDWSGLALNKVLLGMFVDSQAGMLVTSSLAARGVSLAIHTPTSKYYTKFREFIYKKGNITPDRNIVMRYGAELLSFNLVQTPIYVFQIASVLSIRAALDPSVEFEPEAIARGAKTFFENSYWLVYTGKWSMDAFRRFFGSPSPEEVALEDIVTKEQNLQNLEE